MEIVGVLVHYCMPLVLAFGPLATKISGSLIPRLRNRGTPSCAQNHFGIKPIGILVPRYLGSVCSSPRYRVPDQPGAAASAGCQGSPSWSTCFTLSWVTSTSLGLGECGSVYLLCHLHYPSLVKNWTRQQPVGWQSGWCCDVQSAIGGPVFFPPDSCLAMVCFHPSHFILSAP